MKVHPVSSWCTTMYMNGKALQVAQRWKIPHTCESNLPHYQAFKSCKSCMILLLGRMGRPLCIGTIQRSLRSGSWIHMRLGPFYHASWKEFVLPPKKSSLLTSNATVYLTTQNTMKVRKIPNSKIQDGDLKHIIWWEEQMKLCKRPVTKEMVKRLVYTNLLGLDEQLKRGSSKEGSLNSELLDIKRRFPCEVLLCRVGEFYEAIGFDGCILVEYAGLNPMGGVRSLTVPKAGCPIMNLRQTLDDLNQHGFSVCIVEEVQGPTNARQRKDRFVSGHAHPGSPYVYGLAGADIDLDFPEPVPIIGISRSIRGYCLISVLETMRSYSVEDGLTEEAVVAKLRARQYQRLYLHRSVREDSTGLVRWREHGDGGILWGQCSDKVWEWLDKDPINQLLSKVREFFDIDVNEEFRKIIPPSANRPRPLYVGTASQIGILPTSGVPSLLKVLIPFDSHGLCKAYLRDLLLNPPPFHIAVAIQAACRLMADVPSAIPDFSCVAASKLVKLIGAKEVNQLEFSRIHNMAEDILCLDRCADLSPILDLLLQPTTLSTGLYISRQQLVGDCVELVNKIGYVLTSDDDPDQLISKDEYIPSEFFQDMEYSWKGRVKRAHAEAAYSEVKRAAALLSHAIEEDFVPIVLRTRAVTSTLGHANGGAKGEICYYKDSLSVWFKGKHFRPLVWAESPGEKEIKQLEAALDAKGRKAGEDWYTTKRVEGALESYRGAAESAKAKVIEILRNLSEELKQYLNSIVYIAVLSTIAKSLFAHVREGKRREWQFPDLVADEKSLRTAVDPESSAVDLRMEDASFLTSNAPLHLIDVVPYWLDTTKDVAVANSVCINGLVLLTGPNGGGKSSILRSVCAAAVLGLCGLMVPSREAVIPFMDSVLLRMMSHDSPADCKSAFQMEMSELRSIVTETTKNSLVLVDELCKGTEVQKGTCIVASVIETLDNIGCKGIFSTHLHGLLEMDLQVQNLVWKAMDAQDIEGKLTPTWKIVDGICMESLAFETAHKEGVPQRILQRAKQLYEKYAERFISFQHPTSRFRSYIRTFNNDEKVADSRTSKFCEIMELSSAIISSEVNKTMNSDDRTLSCLDSKEFKVVGSQIQANANGFPSSPKKINLSSFQSTKKAKDPSEIAGKRTLLKDVEHIFLSLSISKLQEIYGRMKNGALYSLEDVVCMHVAARQLPPPATTNRSCIYMLQRSDGKFYIGQTDDLVGRIDCHRSFAGMKEVPFIYVIVANKSVASELETTLINQLALIGLDLINKSDQHHRHFGTASDVSPPF